MKKLLIPCVILAAIYADVTQAAITLIGDKISVSEDLGNYTLQGPSVINSTRTTYNADITQFPLMPRVFNGPDGKPFFSLYLDGYGFSLYSMSKPTVGFLDLNLKGLDFNPTVTTDPSTKITSTNYNVLNSLNPLYAVSTNLQSSSVQMLNNGAQDPRYDMNLRLKLDPNTPFFYFHGNFNTVAVNDAAARSHYVNHLATGNIDTAIGASPVPVPASIWLFGSAISAACLSFRKKQMQVA